MLALRLSVHLSRLILPFAFSLPPTYTLAPCASAPPRPQRTRWRSARAAYIRGSAARYRVLIFSFEHEATGWLQGRREVLFVLLCKLAATSWQPIRSHFAQDTHWPDKAVLYEDYRVE